jgi:outer membrane protein insertion porin family
MLRIIVHAAEAWCLAAALLLLIPAPAGAQSDTSSLAPYEGRTVTGIEITGNKVTKDFVITREIRTRGGQPLSQATVASDIGRLDNLSIFAETLVEAKPDGEGVHLTFRFREMPHLIPFLGITHSSENGLSAGPGLSSLNMEGRQISLYGSAYFGGAKQYKARLTWPWITGNHISFAVYGADIDRHDELEGFQERSLQFSPKVGTYLGEHGRLAGMFTIFRMRSDVSGKTLSPDNDDRLMRLGVSLGLDTRDSWRAPRHGWKNEIELWKTGGLLGGDGDYWTLNVDVRRWEPTTPRQKLLLSGLLTMQSGTVGKDLPSYLQYHMGGANSIRGYSVTGLGRKIYGKNQLIGTAEYSFSLLPLNRWDILKWSLRLGLDFALFADIGTAWSDPEEFTRDRFRAGAGAGLRLLVPGTEMVRLDLGWSREGGFRFHFAIGSKPAAQRSRLR